MRVFMASKGLGSTGGTVLIVTVAVLFTAVMLSGPASAVTSPSETATNSISESKSVGNATTAGLLASSSNHRNDTGVLWRGFRHAWSYNHRLSRLGSWVGASCRMERPVPRSSTANCEYNVGHSAAAGSGADNASFRDAYTELSGEAVGFRQGAETVRLQGKEKKPGPRDQTISGSEEVTIRLDDDLKNYDEYTVLLNGFDAHTKSPPAAKIIDFEIGVSDPKTVTNTELTFDIEYEVLMDCDSAECKAGLAGGPGKGVQDIDYPLDIHYLVVGGNQSSFNVESGSTVDNAYGWEACKGALHFNCGNSGNRELDYQNHIQTETIRSKDDYSVNTVGFKSFSINLDSEAHFAQLDMIVGGSDQANYEVRALPFFKEWSSANSPSTSYGHKGQVEVSSELQLLQIKNGCKRSFVQAGGITWETSHTNQRSPTDPSAVVEAPKGRNDYEFEFGDHWPGYTARGSRCTYDDTGIIRPSRDAAFKVNPWRTRDNSVDVVNDEPISLRLRNSDRFYPGDPQFGKATFVDLDDVEVEFKPLRGQSPVPLSGSAMTRTEGGLYLGEVDIHTATAPNSNVEIKHQLVQKVKNGTDGGWTNPFTDGRTIRSPGRYRVLLVVDRPNDGTVPARAIVPFRIVDSTDFIKNQLQWYDLDGSEKSARYRYNTSNGWNWRLNGPGGQDSGVGIKDHVFAERVTLETELQHPPSVSMDTYLSVDGEELASGENVTEYGTHRIASYVCYNPAADGCNSATVSSSSQASTTRTRTRAGPTKSTRTRTGATKAKSKPGGSDQSTAVHPGMLPIAEQNVTIVPSVETLQNVGSDVDTLPSWLLGNEQMRLLVMKDSEQIRTYHATVEDGEITEIKEEPEQPPTLDVLVDAETMGEITNADDPRAAAQRAYENNDITLQSNDILGSIKFGIVRVITDLSNLI
jgi:hypothetical protein